MPENVENCSTCDGPLDEEQLWLLDEEQLWHPFCGGCATRLERTPGDNPTRQGRGVR